MSAESEESENADEEILLRRRRHRKVDGGIEGLNLTAMMDIMTIILVFLIKQYESSPQNITLTDDMTPPHSSSPEELVPGVTLTVSKNAVLLDNKRVFALKGGVPDNPDHWEALGKALGARRDQIIYLHDNSGTSKFDGNILVIADENSSYDIISAVLLQAGREKFTTFKLILQAGGKQ